MSWGEYSAWLAVTARYERRRRAASALDTFHATRGETEGFDKHLERLRADQ